MLDLSWLIPMHQFPECLDLLDDKGAYPPTFVQILGIPNAAIDLLPDFRGHLAWLTGDPGPQTVAQPAFVFAIWCEALAEPLTALITASGFRSIFVILHRPDQAPPATLSGRTLVHFSFDGEPRDAVLGLVEPLVMPLIYRSVIGVALEDFEYLFAQGGRLQCLAKILGEDMEMCLAELAWQLVETKHPLAGHERLLTSILLPSPLQTFSVVDRVVTVVQRSNSHADPVWVISALVHQEDHASICVYAVEAADVL